MRERLIVTQDARGLPCCQVPGSCMWSLVEYLSFQRTAVLYQYRTSCFLVTFRGKDVESAQALLDEWVHAESSDLQTA